MSAANITPDAQTALSQAANFLLSLNAGLGGDNAQADVFSKFLLQSQLSAPQSQPQPQPQLQQTQAQLQQQPAQNQTPVSTSSPASGTADTTAPALPPLPALKKLVMTWRHLVDRLQGQTNKPAVKQQSNSQSNANASAGSPNGTQPNAAPATGTQTSTGSVSGATASGGTSATGDGSGDDAKTIADILKELQMLAVLIEKQLQNLQKTGSADATGTAAATGAPSSSASTSPSALDPSQILADLTALLNPAAGAAAPGDTSSSTGDDASADSTSGATAADGTSGAPTLTQALTDLLTLVQVAAKQLETTQAATTPPSSSGADAADTADTTIAANTNAQIAAATSSLILPSDTQLKADLKVLLTNLRTSVAANRGLTPGAQTQVSSASDTSDAADSSDAADASSAADAATPNLPPATPDATRDAWMQPDDFFNLFQTGSTTRAFNPQGQANANLTASAAANGIVADTGGKGETSSDLDMGGQNNSAAGNNVPANALDNSNLAGAAGNNASSSTNPYSFASQLSEARAANGGMTGLPDAVEQVILQLNHNVKNGDDQMTLHLNPADLGRVDIKLNISSDGKVQGTVVASNPATLHLLLKDVRGLERALQEAGLRADPGSLQFSLGDPSGNSSNQMAGNTSSGSGSSGNAPADAPAPDTISDLSDISADTTETYYLTPTRVNLRV